MTELWIRSKNTSHLNEKQNKNRLRALSLLREYWKKEEFPVNTTHDHKIPQIKDQNGTMCAVAYILQNSGQQELVNEISQKDNYVYVNDLSNDHLLIRSLEKNGISKNEGAKIQPTYGVCEIMPNVQNVEPLVTIIALFLSITGMIIAIAVYRVTSHTSVKTILIASIVVLLVGSSGFMVFYQDSSAYSFPEYGNVKRTISMGEGNQLFYWISDDVIATHVLDRNSLILDIEAKEDGELSVAFPPIYKINSEIPKTIEENMGWFVLFNGEEREFEQTFVSDHYVLTIPFGAGNQKIEIIPSAMCSYAFQTETKNDMNANP